MQKVTCTKDRCRYICIIKKFLFHLFIIILPPFLPGVLCTVFFNNATYTAPQISLCRRMLRLNPILLCLLALDKPDTV
jgi:hypothetical protein